MFRSRTVLPTTLTLFAVATACTGADPSGAGAGGAGMGGAAVGGTGQVGGTTSVGGADSGGVSVGGTSSLGGMGGAGGVNAAGNAGSAGMSLGGAGAIGGSGDAGGLGGSAGSLSTGGSAGAGAIGGNAGNGGSGSGEPVFHVFLLLGQSNMAGYARADDVDKVEDPRIQVLGFDNCQATGRVEGEWDIAAPPLHECGVGAVGPGDHFGKTMIEKYPEGDSIGLVPCALSGEPIETFMKGGNSEYDWIISRAENAQALGGVIEGMIFHQGESNCGSGQWSDQVTTFVQDLRTDLGLGDAPFLAGELLYSGDCSQHNTRVAEIPGKLDNSFVVSAEGLAVDPSDINSWNLHFGHDATVTFGIRYAETMISALGL